MSTARKGALAAGAARATGERARRATTPLIAPDGTSATPDAAAAPAVDPAAAEAAAVVGTDSAADRAAHQTADDTVAPLAEATAAHRPSPTVTSRPTAKARAQAGVQEGRRTARVSPRRKRELDEAARRRLRLAPEPPADASPGNAAADADAARPAPATAAAAAGRRARTTASTAAASATATTAATAATASEGAAGGPEPVRRRPARKRGTAASGAGTPAAASTTEGIGVGTPPADPTAHPMTAGFDLPDLEELVATLLTLARQLLEQSGITTDDVREIAARLLGYWQRRRSGDFEVDDFGLDRDYAENVLFPIVRLLAEKWFRVEVRGIENVPVEGPALVVANHSGTLAFDSMVTQVVVHDHTPEHRILRMLGADLLFETPFLGSIVRRGGSTVATNADAERLFAAGELVGVWPEGFKGVGKPFSERYKLQRFGRGGFVQAALKAQVPIIPLAIVGAEEIAPILGYMPLVARLLGLPYAPITPTFPWLGPLGLIPLPSKWIMVFGEPIRTDEYGPEAADDPMLIFEIADQVRERIQLALHETLATRRSVFF